MKFSKSLLKFLKLQKFLPHYDIIITIILRERVRSERVKPNPFTSHREMHQTLLN